MAGRHLPRRVGATVHAGRVDEDVDRADRPDERADRSLVTDVERMAEVGFVRRDVGDMDAVPFAAEAFADGGTDAAGSPRNESRAVVTRALQLCRLDPFDLPE